MLTFNTILRTYGLDPADILEIASDDLGEKEQRWKDILGTKVHKHGLNRN